MLPDGLQALLKLQDRDLKKSQLVRVLTSIPRERVVIDARIAAHRAAIEVAKKAVIDLELKRKDFETTLRGLEEQIQRYRTQQIQVKKNDSYQALTHEIELTEGKIGELEEKEIELLYELDRVRAKCADVERERKADIAQEEAQLARLAVREKQVSGDVAAAQAEVDAARAEARQEWLPRYDILSRTVGLPVLVALHDQKCGGCHLKVSAGVETEVRKSAQIIACDNCSRILYFEP